MDVFIKKINATVQVDIARMPTPVKEHLFEYGVRQKLADSLSNMAVAKGHTVEEMSFAVGEAIAALVAGEWSARGRTADPVAARAKAIAKATVARYTRTALIAAMKAKGLDISLDDFKAMIVRALSVTPATIAKAKEQLEAEGGETVDLDGLL